ncbi:hypothetical protein [Streptomyces sp. NPDC003401]
MDTTFQDALEGAAVSARAAAVNDAWVPRVVRQRVGGSVEPWNELVRTPCGADDDRSGPARRLQQHSALDPQPEMLASGLAKRLVEAGRA